VWKLSLTHEHDSFKKFEGFGLTCTEVIEREKDGMRICFFPIGDTLIEFLSFSPDKGWDPMHTVLRTQKGTINHLCFEVDDLDASIRDFEKMGPNWQRIAPGLEPTAA
jgi:catechol 2,3-dioxygenase-like lactoylglutathione lyase family enzyme